MSASELRGRIADRTARVAVIGCGYVGLPLLMAFAEAGYRVVGVDVDERKVSELRAGRSYIMDVTDDALRSQLAAGRFDATTDFDVLRSADVIFVAVPTPFDRAKQPDLTFVRAAAEHIAPRLRSGQLIILESTTYPGTTDEVLRPILESGGLAAGKDFLLAFSPERIDPGNRTFRIANTSKVVGGIDEASTSVAKLVLEQVITQGKVHAVSSARAAELAKLLENTFRAVNIALVNELAMLCDRMDIDIWEVIDAAATKPYGFMAFYPGPGVGGHCIPVDPYYLSWKAREYDFHTKFIELAAETNLGMPFFTVARVRRLLGDHDLPLRGARILTLGASFKKDIDDARNSSAIRVMEILLHEGARIEYHDPFVERITLNGALYGGEPRGVTLRSVPLDAARVAGADCVVVLVGHSGVDYAMVRANAKLVFDAVNATGGRSGAAHVERL
ncbi:MAG: nucleotide sugar dehydrogenase [Chloroflexi bacterium]|nr:nucleotide sugar dehydrogenase [Chloroflexota bacterium]